MTTPDQDGKHGIGHVGRGNIMKLFEFFNVPEKEKSQVNSQGQRKDEHELEDELFWYILDHDDLHKQHVLPFVKNIKQQVMDKQYNKDKFKKYLVPMIDKGCDLYYKEEKLSGNPHEMFNKDIKDSVNTRIVDEIISAIEQEAFNIGDHKI